ncbi:MAG TPA: hypothetical protein VFK10_02180 [Burkholderiaceae bacterium]|nr:hypothetical protein [Burkholderiaceae bacterium]
MTASLQRHSPTVPMPAWLDASEPVERDDRIAARRNFVHVKRCFMAAVERVDGRRGLWLRDQVRQANEPVDLWLLRGAVFDAVSSRGPAASQELRLELQLALDSVMPSADDDVPLRMAF